MGGCQNYDPFLDTLNSRCRIIIGIQKGIRILTATHIGFWEGTIKGYTSSLVQGSYSTISPIKLQCTWESLSMWSDPAKRRNCSTSSTLCPMLIPHKTAGWINHLAWNPRIASMACLISQISWLGTLAWPHVYAAARVTFIASSSMLQSLASTSTNIDRSMW